jgi:transposase
MFCVKLSKSATETLEMLCEEHSLNRTAVYEWHSCFKAGQVSVEDGKRSGQPRTYKMTENVEKIRELIHEDCSWTFHELADTVGISYGVYQEALGLR